MAPRMDWQIQASWPFPSLLRKKTVDKPTSVGNSILMTRDRMDPQERRGQILNTARRLMMESGSEGVRVEDILAELSLSKGGFYHHFKSMNDVLGALVAQDLAALLDAMERRSGESQSATKALLALFEYGSDDRQGSSGILESLNSRNHRLAYLEILEEQLYKPFREVLGAVVRRGMDSGEFTSRPLAGIVLIFEAINRQLNRQAILQEDVSEIAETRQIALQMLFRELEILERSEVQRFMASWTRKRKKK